MIKLNNYPIVKKVKEGLNLDEVRMYVDNFDGSWYLCVELIKEKNVFVVFIPNPFIDENENYVSNIHFYNFKEKELS